MLEKFKKPICSLLALSMAVTLCACGKDKNGDTSDETTIDPNQSTVAVKAKDNLFSLGYDADASLNPLTTKSSANYIVDCLVYEFAVDLDPDYNPVPNIITSWDTDNGMNWTFKIDTSIKFHDGTNVTAADVAYSINRARNNSVYSGRLNKIWGITAANDETLLITLSIKNYMFPRLLNVPVVKANSEGSTPAGTGQYTFNEDKTQLVKYADHRFAENTPIDVIYLRPNGTPEEKIAAYSASILDLVINDPSGLSRLGYGSNNEVRHFPTTNMQYIGFNLKSEFACYSTYRYAFNYIIDRDYIVNNILNGSAMVATLPISPASNLYNKELANQYKFDKIMAVNALNGAGVQDYDADEMLEYQLPGGIAEIELDFIVPSDNTDKVKAAKRIVEDLASIGITVKLRQLSWTDYVNAIVEGKYDMCYGEIRLTADFNLMDMLTTKGMKNFYGINDPNYYDIIEAYLAAPSETERRERCDAMCKFLAEQAAIIPICFEEQQVLTHRDVVSGLEPTQYNVFYNLKNWTIDLSAAPEATDKEKDNDKNKGEDTNKEDSESATTPTVTPVVTPSEKPQEDGDTEKNSPTEGVD